jgi:hypothetical protein
VNERGPKNKGLTVCIVLALVLILATLEASNTIVALALMPVIAGLLVTEFDRSGGLIATRIVRLASRLLPKSRRADYADEWVDHVLAAGDEGLHPVLAAL